MFNEQNSAYGRGITSNLVSEEQRQRFNSGGRVRLQGGTEPLLNYKESDVYKELYPPSSLIGSTNELLTNVTQGLHNYIARPLSNIPPYVFGYGEGLNTYKPRDFRKEAVERWDPDWEKNLQAKKDEEASKLQAELGDKDDGADDRGIKKVDPISDTLDWTPQEKKEKKGQIQLKLAQRLVGGARDPWGSAKQMKNVGDWLGDVAAIGDKTELRKEERKYQAWAKAKKDIARDVQASTLEYNNLRAAGVGEAKALDISTGGKIKARTITSSTNKKMRKKSLANVQKGDIIYDEDIQSFTLKDYVDSSGKHIPIEKEKLVEVQEDFLKKGA